MDTITLQTKYKNLQKVYGRKNVPSTGTVYYLNPSNFDYRYKIDLKQNLVE